MSNTEALRAAAQAVLDRWDSPQWEWTKHSPTADLMHALRLALAQPAASGEPVALIRTWHKGGEQHAELWDWGDGLDALPDGDHKLYTPAQSAPALVPTEWAPVTERMPKSGVTVLACYRNSAGNLRRIRAEWVAAKTQESGGDSDIGVYDEDTDTTYDPEGWYEQIDNWDDGFSAIGVHQGEVTHWMPLPAAPDAPTVKQSLTVAAAPDAPQSHPQR